mgnify:CR=1 FL=1
MANKITLKAQDGSTVEFYDEIKAQGGVKDVYFSTDKTYVVQFFRKKFFRGWKIEGLGWKKGWKITRF